MKYVLIMLFASALLTSCGGRETIPEEPPAAEQVTLSEAIPEGLTMTLEREIYDPSLETYTYIIENRTDETITLGEDYSLEKQSGEEWHPLTMKPDQCWNALAYMLEPGDQLALQCGFSGYTEKPAPGSYRLVKELQLGEREVQLTAEFSLGESPYTAAAPYGFLPLETLPEQYSAADAAREHLVTVTEKGITHKESVTLFVQKVNRGIPCQLRIVQEFNEGNTMVMDAVFEQDRFLWRVRSGGGITEKYFSYLVTDGQSVCLSNGADWETSEKLSRSELVYLLPEGTGGLEKAAEIIGEMTGKRLSDGALRYRSWSPDGLLMAALGDVLGEVSISSAERGETFQLRDEQGKITPVIELEWEDGLLLIYTADGARAFDPEIWSLYG